MTPRVTEYLSNMTRRAVRSSFFTVVVTVTGFTTMPVEQLRMS
jgi:hypothetical protein